MNHIYRLVWSRVAHSWVAVRENARGRGKTQSRGGKRVVELTAAALSVSAVCIPLSPAAYAANASDASIAAGNGSAKIATVGTTTTINQSSERVVIDWTSLSTAANEALVFNQPNASAVALNRITGSSPSTFLGSLSANGQVYILNPNGVLFGAGAQVNVGGLVASTMQMDAAAFMNGSGTFTQAASATGTVVNQGSLNAASGGYIALLGKTVRNDGTITAPLGTAALGAGSSITLTFSGNSLVHMQVDQSVFNTLAENGGLIQADGGVVVMTAGAADSLLASVVNNTGTIEARTVENHAGTITLLGGMQAGTVNVDGTLDASAQNGGNGGAIETSAATVNVANSASIDTRAPQGLMGSWLIDPIDFTVAASGGNITGAALSAELKSTNVTLDTVNTTGTATGNINIDDAVNWSSNSVDASSHTLTLNAANNININAPITWGVSGTPGDAATTGALVLNAGGVINIGAAMNAYWRAPLTMNTGPTSASVISTVNVDLLPNAGGFSGSVNFFSDAGTTAAGGTGLLTINGNAYTVISDVTPGSGVGVAGDTGTDSLQGMQNNLSGYYALGSNIDASATASWNGGAGFAPISTFTGVFDGLGHTISGLTEFDTQLAANVGLFGDIMATTVCNVGLVGASVAGSGYVGILVGFNHIGTVTNSFATGTVSGGVSVGGLVGANEGTTANSYADAYIPYGASFAGNYHGAGGLVGSNFGTIENSYAIGAVNSIFNAGGLAGSNWGGAIIDSYATGTVWSRTGAGGGLAGYGGESSSITQSYATGAVTGAGDAGGLEGKTYGSISDSYATGSVSVLNSGSTSAILGGLVGIDGGSIANSYATGNVSNATIAGTGTAGETGGLVGMNYGGSITNSYATGAVTGARYVGGLVGANFGPFNISGSIHNSYETGVVTGTDSATTGGLVGAVLSTGSVTDSFYDSDANPTLTGIGGSVDLGGVVWGMSTAALQNSANFTSATGTSNPTDHSGNGDVNPAWDLPGAGNGAGSTWFMYSGFTTLLLQAFLTPLTITANNVSTQYDGTAFYGGNGVTYSVTPDLSLLSGTLTYSGSAQGAVGLGDYVISVSGLYSAQNGYMITFVDGRLSIVNTPPATTGGTGGLVTASNDLGQVEAWVLSKQNSGQASASRGVPDLADAGTASDDEGDVTIKLGSNGSTLHIERDAGGEQAHIHP
ncbi:filamentous hemagglutinin N-terminal domain-containing protein [Pararobbsia silviterrae]|uniref:Filamentous hemagglutinin N-terminal domain-containing protein n=1 Tax=Pararobbsia silviterrae TaxID=1792498 RepID=A0A494XAF2_9BURK|nr:filamentous hemagglutinin N-terminal domain-containing protein [Pararobbsia silviterrae]RKP47797.1 filamentous hemagglutinin N-terminal domain-containing protein [Pararobbsia silviterrae]